MYVIAETFWLPKEGYTSAEYEDAYYSNYLSNNNLIVFHGAVADGATETSFAAQWAQILVRAYCEEPLNRDNLINNLPALQQQWIAQVTTKPLPWYAEEKLRRGACSALVGLTLFQENQRGEALAIGDSCLFHISQDQLKNCFPLQHSQFFDNTPFLLSSNQSQNALLSEQICQLEMRWQVGDEFYLMTDALASWFLQEYERKRKPWRQLRQLNQNQFPGWIIELRETSALKNDDVTLMRIFL